jgi:transposase
MAGKFIVGMTAEERSRVEGLVSKGKGAAATLTHARILLKADTGSPEDGWHDERIAEALDVSLSTIYRVRQAFVEQGLEAALFRKRPTGRLYRKLDGAAEAKLIALACSAPPEGRTRWTLQLLADKLVALEVVDSISDDTVQRTLKKTTSSRG